MDIIGYNAAFFSNASIYPQAFMVYRIVSEKQYYKLANISTITYCFFVLSSVLWFIYAYANELYPIYAGSIMCIIPSLYILYVKGRYYVFFYDNGEANKILPEQVLVEPPGVE